MHKYLKLLLAFVAILLPALAMEEKGEPPADIAKTSKKLAAQRDPNALYINGMQLTDLKAASAKAFVDRAAKKNKSCIKVTNLPKGVLHLPPLDKNGQEHNVNDLIRFLDMLKLGGVVSAIKVKVNSAHDIDLTAFWKALNTKLYAATRVGVGWHGVLEVLHNCEEYDNTNYSCMPDFLKKSTKVEVNFAKAGIKDIADFFGNFSGQRSFKASVNGFKLPIVRWNKTYPVDLPKGKSLMTAMFHNAGQGFDPLWKAMAGKDWSDVYELIIADANSELLPASYEKMPTAFKHVKKLVFGAVKATHKSLVEVMIPWAEIGMDLDSYLAKSKDTVDSKSKAQEPFSFGVNLEKSLQLPPMTPDTVQLLPKILKLIKPASVDGLVLQFADLGSDPSNLISKLIDILKIDFADICKLTVTSREMPFDDSFLPLNNQAFPNVANLSVGFEKMYYASLRNYIKGFNSLKMFEFLAGKQCQAPEELISTFKLLFQTHKELCWLSTTEKLACSDIMNHSDFKSMLEDMKECPIEVLELVELEMLSEVKDLLNALPELKFLVAQNTKAYIKKYNYGSEVIRVFDLIKNLYSYSGTMIFYEYWQDEETNNWHIESVDAARAKALWTYVEHNLKSRKSGNGKHNVAVAKYSDFTKERSALKKAILKPKQVREVKKG